MRSTKEFLESQLGVLNPGWHIVNKTTIWDPVPSGNTGRVVRCFGNNYLKRTTYAAVSFYTTRRLISNEMLFSALEEYA